MQKLIEIEKKLIGPAGLMLPWDHYGWFKATNGAPLAYLANLDDHDTASDHLATIHHVGMTQTPGMMAWGHDNPLWTLAWWPENLRDFDAASHTPLRSSWCLPRTGAGHEDGVHNARLVQVWDRSADCFTSLGRAQVNPNHLMLQVGDQPVFQDGIPVDGFLPFELDAQQMLATMSDDAKQRLSVYAAIGKDRQADAFTRSQAAGMLGAANAIVIDDCKSYWPGRARCGHAAAFGANDVLSLATGEAAAFYKPAFDITRARRTTIWHQRFGLGIVLDDLAAESDHAWTWQAFLRPDAKREGRQVSITLGDGKQVTLAWDDPCDVSLEHVQGYPRSYEGASARLSLTTRGSSARFAVAVDVTGQQVRIKRDSSSSHAWIIQQGSNRHHVSFDAAARKCIWRTTRDGHADITHELTFESHEAPAEDVIEMPALDLDDSLASVHAASPSCDSAGDNHWLAMADACFEMVINPQQARAGNAARLETMLRDARLYQDHCAVLLAAADVAGRLGCRELAPALLALLEQQEAIAHDVLYATDDKGASIGHPARWRIKAAAIAALGKVGDAQAAQLITASLARGTDFYAVQSVAAQALQRLHYTQATDTLKLTADDPEINTALRSACALHAMGQGL